MKEFDYNIDYKNIMFTPNDTRYRIGRGEQGVLLVRPYGYVSKVFRDGIYKSS
jgi:hypothetical protein